MTHAPNPPDLDRDARYRALIEREASHFGEAEKDAPQLWDDPVLHERVLGPPYRDLVERVVAVGGPALELGSGDGDLALDLAARGVDVTGIELSAARVARADAEAAQRGLTSRARFVTGDLNTITLERARYACVVAHDALHHVLALDRLLDEVHAALAPGGTLLVSDFTGASRVEKLASAAVIALLPSTWSYHDKWRMSRRLKVMLASERERRTAFEQAAPETLHETSPFEGISQESIARGIHARFDVVRTYTFCPYWYHAIPKLKLPRALQRALIEAFLPLDRRLNRRGLTRGSYVFLEARRRPGDAPSAAREHAV